MHAPAIRQRGVTLVEALIAFLVLALGVLAMSKLQSQLQRNADIARQRSEAVRLAQEDMELVRASATIASASVTITPGAERAGNTSFHLDRHVVDDGGRRDTSVSVDWADRSGATQRVVLRSVIDGTAPSLSAALALHRDVRPLHMARARSVAIPAFARDLGHGSSAFKPNEAGTLAFIVDNATGLVTARCDSVPASVRSADLSAASLGACTSVKGFLLGGVVRFSVASPPDARHPADPSGPLDIQLTLTGASKSTPPSCITAQHERDVAYHCVVFTAPWSGRSDLVPKGWTLGSSAADRKVCRYSSDQDGSGAVDANPEHPADYKDVDRPLMQQNFLVIRGDQACPVFSKGATDFADLSTVQHQP